MTDTNFHELFEAERTARARAEAALDTLTARWLAYEHALAEAVELLREMRQWVVTRPEPLNQIDAFLAAQEKP